MFVKERTIQRGKVNDFECREHQDTDLKHTARGASEGTQEGTHLTVECAADVTWEKEGPQSSGPHFLSKLESAKYGNYHPYFKLFLIPT